MKGLQQAIAVAAMSGSLCVAGAALGAEPAVSAGSKSATDMSAMRVVVDPETGEVRAPTDEELRALIEAEKAATQAQKTARSATPTAQQVLPAQKSVVHHANGMVSTKLSQDTLSAVKVETDSAGKTRVVHEGETLTAAAEEK